MGALCTSVIWSRSWTTSHSTNIERATAKDSGVSGTESLSIVLLKGHVGCIHTTLHTQFRASKRLSLFTHIDSSRNSSHRKSDQELLATSIIYAPSNLDSINHSHHAQGQGEAWKRLSSPSSPYRLIRKARTFANNREHVWHIKPSMFWATPIFNCLGHA